MTTTTDIGNRALQLVGTRTTMTSLAELSNEAIQVNLAFVAIQNWCSGLANWNFARNTVGLSVAKTAPGASPPTWSNIYPPPPWAFEYTLPADYVRAIYVTNSAAATASGYLGEPQRFAMGLDTISSTEQTVLYTNQAGALLIYTAFVTNPTAWPWHFERLMVLALAVTICMPLTGDKKLLEELSAKLEQQINIATQINTIEGLMIPDTTPEWIQALGINYPFRRLDSRVLNQPQSGPRKGGDQ